MDKSETNKLKTPRTTRVADLFAFGGFAVAQPLYDLLGNNAEILVTHRAGSVEILAIVLLLSCIVPGIPALLIICLRTAFPRGADWTHQFVTWTFAFLALMPISGALLSNSLLQTTVSLGLATVLASLYGGARRRGTVTQPVLISAIVALAFPLLFLSGAEVRKLLFDIQPEAIETGHRADVSPIIFVVFDGLSTAALMNEELEINEALYPNFSELSQHSHWFKNATSLYSHTERAVPSLLTGSRTPLPIPVPTAVNYESNLFTLLSSSYEMNVWETITELCPETICKPRESIRPPLAARILSLSADIALIGLHIVAPTELSQKLPPVDQAWGHFMASGDGDKPEARPAPTEDADSPIKDWRSTSPWKSWLMDNRPERFERYLNSITRTSDPTVHFLHSMLPHAPYVYSASGEKYGKDSGLKGLQKHGIWGTEPEAPARSYQRYLFQVQLVDRLLGRLVDRLKELGVYDQGLIIVTSDHGVSFVPGESRRNTTERNHAEIMPVPLFIKLPFQEQGVVSIVNAQATDVFPTLADVIGLDMDIDGLGRSLVDSRAPAPDEKTAYHNMRELTFDGSMLESLQSAVSRKFLIFEDGDPEKGPRVQALPGHAGK